MNLGINKKNSTKDYAKIKLKRWIEEVNVICLRVNTNGKLFKIWIIAKETQIFQVKNVFNSMHEKRRKGKLKYKKLYVYKSQYKSKYFSFSSTM